MTTIKKINGKQTKIKLTDGQRFKAKDDGGGACQGCAFYDLRVACPHNEFQHVICTPQTRDDKRSIIWVHRKVKPPEPLPPL